jgi:hypothetical protein
VLAVSHGLATVAESDEVTVPTGEAPSLEGDTGE